MFTHTVRWRSVRRNTTALPLIALIVLLLMGLNACAPNGQGNSITPTQSQGTVTIGVSLSLTGTFAADGQATRQGYALWQDEVNRSGGLLGHQVRLDVLDDNSNIAQTQSNYERLIAVDHVNFVVGPFAEAPTVTGAQVAARHGYAFLEGIGTSPSTFQKGLTNLFAVSLSAKHYLTSFVHYVLSLPVDSRPKTVAYVSSNDAFTQPQIDSVKPLLEQGGLSTAYYAIFPGSTTDYTLLAQKVVASRADLVLLGTLGEADCVPLIKTFIQQRFNPRLIIATAGPDQGATFVNAIGKQNTEGLLVPNDGWWPALFALGVGIEWAFLRRIRRERSTRAILVLFAVAMVIEGGLSLVFTTDDVTLHAWYTDATVRIAGFYLPVIDLFAFALSVVLLAVLSLLLYRTTFGYSLRATVQNRTAAALIGIDVERVQAITFGLGTALAGAGGIAFGATNAFHPASSYDLISRLLVIIVLGGMGSLAGALIGSLAMLVIGDVTTVLWSPAWSSFVFFALLILFLVFRPQGIFGQREGRRQ